MCQSEFSTKIKAIWDMKTDYPKETSIDQMKPLYTEIRSKLNECKEKLIHGQIPKIDFPKLQPKAKRKFIRTITIRNITRLERYKTKDDFGANQHFYDLDQKLLKASNGKISLNSIGLGTKKVVKIEGVCDNRVQFEKRFSENFKVQVFDLKCREDQLKQQAWKIRGKRDVKLVDSRNFYNQSQSLISNSGGKKLNLRRGQITNTLPHALEVIRNKDKINYY